MPIDPRLRHRFHLLEGIASFDEALRSPELMNRLQQFMQEDSAYEVPEVHSVDRSVPGPTGPFRVRVYSPPSATSRATSALVWAHGGGFTGGSLDMPEADTVSRELCSRAGGVVVSVDYHLADGTASYPTLHQQVVEAYEWTLKKSSTLGINKDQVFLGGASAGANLAVAATLALRERQRPLPAGLVLAYPFLHQKIPGTPALERLMRELPPLLRFSQETINKMYDAYRNGLAEAPLLSLEGNNLIGFPPSLVVLSEYDDLRPSGEAYALQAMTEGVHVRTYLAEGMLHGHLNRPPVIREVGTTLDHIASFLKTSDLTAVPSL